MRTYSERIKYGRALVMEASLTAALRPYRAKTVEHAAAVGRHLFQVGTIQSLCMGVAISPQFPLEALPAVDLASVTCLGCLRRLIDRLRAA
jgi:hypothetical protein